MLIPEGVKKYLNGDYGEIAAKITKSLVTIGEVKGALRMVPITSAHTSTMIYQSTGIEGLDLLDALADSGARFTVPTSVDPVSIDIDNYQALDIPDAYAKAQMRSVRSFEKLGGLRSYTCTPWNCGNVPRAGEHIAWVDTSAVIFANSVLGARTNRYVDPAALAAAITGYVPECGLHLPENRYANVVVKVEAKLESKADFALLGVFAARTFGSQIFVFTGMEEIMLSHEILHSLGPALSTWGNVALFHVVNHTPEAPTLESVLGEKVIGEALFDEKHLDQMREEFSLPLSTNHLVLLGCPHYTISEVRDVAQIVEGKRINPNDCLWVLTDRHTRVLAEEEGLLEIIEKAGGRMVAEMCWLLSIKTQEIVGKYGSVATDSAKAAFNSCSLNFSTTIKSRRECLEQILERGE